MTTPYGTETFQPFQARCRTAVLDAVDVAAAGDALELYGLSNQAAMFGVL
ncbi:hypothetical protein [Nocardia salmonicida]